MTVSGEEVANEARMLASWSTRIPGSVRLIARGLNSAVKAGGSAAPHAKPYEHSGVAGTFRHPVFGNRENWVPQKARPFLGPAAAANSYQTRRNAEVAVQLVLFEAGFR